VFDPGERGGDAEGGGWVGESEEGKEEVVR
jgi:hypothetical protein